MRRGNVNNTEGVHLSDTGVGLVVHAIINAEKSKAIFNKFAIEKIINAAKKASQLHNLQFITKLPAEPYISDLCSWQNHQ